MSWKNVEKDMENIERVVREMEAENQNEDEAVPTISETVEVNAHLFILINRYRCRNKELFLS